MKLRNGFASNSSSSSFLVIGEPLVNQYFKNKGLKYCDLNTQQKAIIIKQDFCIPINEKVYLTQFISDSFCDWDWVDDEWDPVDGVIEYRSGGHRGPYIEEFYEEISNDVWLERNTL